MSGYGDMPPGVAAIAKKYFGAEELAVALPALEHHLASLCEAVDRKVQTLHANGELTPERAKEAWVERIAYAHVMSRLTQAVRGASDARATARAAHADPKGD